MRPGLKLIILILQGAPVCAQQAAKVQQGDFWVVVETSGTVKPGEKFDLKAPIEGRIETIQAQRNTWAAPDETLALMADKELAALMDAEKSASKETLEAQWKGIYKPAVIQCPYENCFILKSFERPKKWVKYKTMLFEGTQSLNLTGQIAPEDCHWVHEGQTLEFWANAEPQNKLSAAVDHVNLKLPGKCDLGATITATLGPRSYLNPGTTWTGTITALHKKDVLTVPTEALIRYKDSVYLPVKVSTGITRLDSTEIIYGAEENRPFLILSAKELNKAEPHKPAVEKPVIETAPISKTLAPAVAPEISTKPAAAPPAPIATQKPKAELPLKTKKEADSSSGVIIQTYEDQPGSRSNSAEEQQP